jgi:hypothetical protein
VFERQVKLLDGRLDGVIPLLPPFRGNLLGDVQRESAPLSAE